MKEAMFYRSLGEKQLQCLLCPRSCRIAPGRTGFCRVRENRGGRLFSMVYGKLCSMGVDPIEKKPLFHYAPGSFCLSICTVGCNLDCKFCQNWEISHPGLSRPDSGDASRPLHDIPGEDVPPARIVELAVKQGVDGLSYTYTEPTIFYEYALDTMKLAKKKGFYNCWVSNGFTNPGPAMEASRYLDAINIDLKGSESFYRELCNAPGEAAVKKAAKIYKEQGVWLEVTTLVIPGYNDSARMLTGISRWVRKNLGPETPIHFSRFHPHFRMRDVKSTPTSTLEKAHRIARKEGLHYVYVGNVWGHRGESTFCPKCGRPLIERRGFEILAMRDTCECGHKLAMAGREWSRLK